MAFKFFTDDLLSATASAIEQATDHAVGRGSNNYSKLSVALTLFADRCTQSRVDRPDRRHRLERVRELAQSILKLACAFRAMDEVCIAYGTSSGSLFHWQDFGFHEVDSNAALGPHSER
jgi:hypothetical protein